MSSSCYSTQPSNYNQPAHIGALFTILVTSFIGTCLPVVARRYPLLRIPSFLLDAGRAFGTGVVIATGFVHMLPPAITNLSSQCLPYFFTNTYDSLGAAVALAAALSIQLLEISSTVILNRIISKRNIQQSTDNKENSGSLQCTGRDRENTVLPLLDQSSYETTIATASGYKLKILVIIFEMGVAFHSVIIGLNLGVSTGSTFRTLFAALVFHQFFEGFAIGTTVAEAQFSSWITLSMILCYSLETPIGISIGMGIAHTYQENSAASLVTRGILDGVSGGILIYTGLVELLTYWFTRNSHFVNRNSQYTFSIIGVVWLGAICMSIIGAWA
ncbi:hypothetical protein GpartN1_g7730.t1 [Galdieria partita]|uniref:Uncharacterized protein n=1 Tax=Galdieria partita TaxID=83374 RepID=A0A9C7UU10_9RHOD|nr:hypothetical protein GpartN1_g7730.t1 [Galdieria partita]